MKSHLYSWKHIWEIQDILKTAQEKQKRSVWERERKRGSILSLQTDLQTQEICSFLILPLQITQAITELKSKLCSQAAIYSSTRRQWESWRRKLPFHHHVELYIGFHDVFLVCWCKMFFFQSTSGGEEWTCWLQNNLYRFLFSKLQQPLRTNMSSFCNKNFTVEELLADKQLRMCVQPTGDKKNWFTLLTVYKQTLFTVRNKVSEYLKLVFH